MTAASVTRKYRASIPTISVGAAPKSTGRRTTLPSFCPDNSHVGLMTILYNNIGKLPLTAAGLWFNSWLFSEDVNWFPSGKDLARVSMPAALNEPINLLQRLCEELEYCEVLDTANNTPDPYQRMVNLMESTREIHWNWFSWHMVLYRSVEYILVLLQTELNTTLN